MLTGKNLISILIIISAFALLYNYSNLKTEYIPNSPDEAQSRFFAYHFIETGELQWESELNNKYGTTIFAPRNLAALGQNVYAPKKPLLYILTMATFGVFSRIEYFTPVFGLLGIMVFFLVLRKLAGNKIALVSSIFIGISPVYLLYSVFYWEHVPALVLTFLAYYTFLRFQESRKTAYLILTGLFLVVAIFMRPVDILSISSFVVVLLLFYWKSFSIRSVVITGFIFIISSIPYLFLNKLVFGGFFNIPEIMRASSYLEQSDYSVIPMDINMYYASFMNHVILVQIVSAMAVMGIIYVLLRGNSHLWKFSIAVLAYCLVIFVFYGARDTTYAFGGGNIFASLNRYFLPISAMSYLFAGIFIGVLSTHFKKTTIIKPITALAILLVVVISLRMSLVSSGGVNERSSTMQRWSQRIGVIRQLPEDSIVFTSEGDKYIFPTRNVAITYTSDSPKIIERPDTALIYQILDVENEFVPLITKLNNDRMSTYITHESNTLPLINQLRGDDRFELETVNTWLYKIELR